MRVPRPAVPLVALLLACTHGPPEQVAAVPKPNIDPAPASPAPVRVPDTTAAPKDTVRRVAPPELAYSRGWMSLASTGVDRFLRTHPTYDGRGVLLAILDTGVDPGIPGLATTSAGGPKLLDVRDFSGEGVVPLARVTPAGDSVDAGGRRLGGFGRVASLGTTGPYYAGAIREIPLGEPPAADLNGNGRVADTLPVVVVRAPDGWVLFADTDGDGSLAGERPVHDYLQARESFGWARRGGTPPMTVAATFGDSAGAPRLDLVFDATGHGTHVAGIAAAHDLYGVPGFDGVAPGAQLLGLKIANNKLVSTTGSILRAMDYAIRFAEARRMPLVMNLSFGVGNEIEGQARIDEMVDSVLGAHPDVVLAISAGNDGPGLSTVGFPGSARRAISVGATLPGRFLPPGPAGAPLGDRLAYFSSRGGELARPDLVAPGVAYSSVPHWDTGDEVEQGTSMAAPHVAGLAALLVSAAAQEHRPVAPGAIRQALMVTAQPTPGQTYVDEGTGLPDVARADEWLRGGYAVPDIQVRPLGGGPVSGAIERVTGAVADTTPRFELLRPASAPPASYTLRSDVPWLLPPARVTLRGARTPVRVRIDRRTLVAPGAYVGTVTGWSADTMAGPAFRLVTTIAVAAPATDSVRLLRERVTVPPDGTLRTFFAADSGRPFVLSIETAERAQRALAFLHEPAGMPFRDEAARNAGFGPLSADYEPDAHDVVAGAYEAVVVAPPGQPISATVRLTQSPLTLQAERRGDSVRASVTNVTGTPVPAAVGMHLGGGVRTLAVSADGSEPQRIPFVLPAWSRGVVFDLSMDRAQWPRFTDFSVTLLDSLGHPMGNHPLNYAFGRMQVELPKGHGDVPVTLELGPGFADPAGDQRWSLRASIKLYADSSVVLSGAGVGTEITVAPHQSAHADFALPQSPWPLGPGFAPLGLLVARAGGRSWTREVTLGGADRAPLP